MAWSIGRNQAQVLRAMMEHNKLWLPLPPDEMGWTTGFDHKKTIKILKSLVKVGLVENTSIYGHYFVVTEAGVRYYEDRNNKSKFYNDEERAKISEWIRNHKSVWA